MSAFTEAVAANVPEGYDIVAACEEDCEGWFSSQPCELCGSRQGGERHRAALICPGRREHPTYLSVCEDCICYLANGDEPVEWTP